MGKTVCPACEGRGSKPVLDLMKAKTVRKPCEKCGGTGEIVEKQKDGIICGQIEGITFVWQHLVEFTPVSTLEVRIRPVRVNGVPQVKKDRLFKKLKPRIFAEIVRMNTEPEHRKKGLMDQLLKVAQGDPRIEWFETNWKDSTEDGRAFLQKRGFQHEGTKLIWERQDVEGSQSNASDGKGAELGQGNTNQGGRSEGPGGSVSNEDTQRTAGTSNVAPSAPSA